MFFHHFISKDRQTGCLSFDFSFRHINRKSTERMLTNTVHDKNNCFSRSAGNGTLGIHADVYSVTIRTSYTTLHFVNLTNQYTTLSFILIASIAFGILCSSPISMKNLLPQRPADQQINLSHILEFCIKEKIFFTEQ